MLGLVVLLCSISCAVLAVPSLSGPTGLVVLPNADIASRGTLDLGLNYQSGQGSDSFIAGLNPSAGLRMLYGISGKCEIGAGFVNQTMDEMLMGLLADVPPELPDYYDSVRVNNWTVDAKYRLPFSYGGFAWAVGGIHQRFTRDISFSWQKSVVYLAGTKAIDCPCSNGIKARGTVGLNYMRGKLGDYDWAMGETTTRYCPSVGIEANLPKKVTLIGEYMLTPGADMTSIALRVPTSVNTSLQLGLTNSLDGFDTSAHHTVMLGLNYKLGNKF